MLLRLKTDNNFSPKIIRMNFVVKLPHLCMNCKKFVLNNKTKRFS